MEVGATSTSAMRSGADTVVIGVFEGESVSQDDLSRPLNELLNRGEAGAETGRIAMSHIQDIRVLLLGLGARTRFDAERARAAAALAHRRARELRTRRLAWQVPAGAGP